MITIFTPTYNRGYRLPRLYQSLREQTDYRFEWLIVDDGSGDNTQELVEAWMSEEQPFEIRYYYQQNGGKHVAINTGVQYAKYDWFFIVDSDDYLLDNAVQQIIAWIETVNNPEIAAVSGTKCYPDGIIIGGCGLKNDKYLDAKSNERNRYHLGGDKAEVFRTAVLRKYPFPVFPNENFLSEGAVWDKIALDGYKIRWFSAPTTVCEYLSDGLTANNKSGDLHERNFQGYTYTTKIGLKATSGLDYMRTLCWYIKKAKKKGLSNREIAERLEVKKSCVDFFAVAIWVKVNIGEKL